MTSLQIKILITLACVSIVYAFACKIRLSRKAARVANRIQEECPDLWAELNAFARNYDGGLPGLKVLYRKGIGRLPLFDQQYAELRALEHKLRWGIGIGSACLGLAIAGSRFWGWDL
jgi:hypothetical protein